MIDDLLKKQPKRLASEKQINFLLKIGVDWVKDVELTSEDASFMISGLMRGNTSKVNDMSSMFSASYNLEYIDISKFKTSQVESMRYMFNGCNKLKSIKLGSIDTKNVKDMEGMFAYCSSLTSLDLSNLNKKCG